MRNATQTLATWPVIVAGLLAGVTALDAQQSTFNARDDYTEYNLLAPSSHQFHIVYYLSQRQVGAATVLNQTRSGSEGSNISVRDPRTGEPLKFEYKTGAELAAAGETGRLAPAEHYIRAFLPRPVPEGGEGRVRIEKTYLDEKSYFEDAAGIVFARSLGIGRNAIVLPAGYALASSNVAAQVVSLTDGRIKVTFENVNTYAADVTIRGRKTAAKVTPALQVVERAFDFAKTLYDLGDPAAHTIAVRHEYVETRPGARAVLGVLARHRLTGVVVTDMDTGRPLRVVEASGGAAAELESPIVNDRQTAHLRVTGREDDRLYRIDNGQLAWEKTLVDPRTTVLLPPGWEITAISTPATVTTTREDRVSVQIYNPRLEPVAFALRAVRRPEAF